MSGPEETKLTISPWIGLKNDLFYGGKFIKRRCNGGRQSTYEGK